MALVNKETNTSRESKEKFISMKIKNYKEIRNTVDSLRAEGLEGTANEVIKHLVDRWEENENRRGDEVL